MTYQIEVKHLGATVTKYDGIESPDPVTAIDRIIRQHYDYIEYKNELVVVGCEFIARQLNYVLS